MTMFNTVHSMEHVVPSTGDKVIAAIQLFYGIPSFTLMFALFFFLGLSKNYQHSFYRLVQLDLFTNMLCYLNTWLAVRLEKHVFGVMFLKSLEEMVPGSLSFSKMMLNFFLHMQFGTSSALNLHRSSSVRFYATYEMFWSRYYIFYGLVCAAYSTLPLLLIHSYVLEVSIINGTLMSSFHSEVIGKLVILNATCSLIYFLISLILGMYTAVLVSKTVRTYNSDDHGTSKKLTKVSFTYTALYTGILLWSFISAMDSLFPFLPGSFEAYMMDILMFSSDMMTLSLPYILLLNDSNIKRNLMPLLSRRETSRTNNTVFISSSANQK